MEPLPIYEGEVVFDEPPTATETQTATMPDANALFVDGLRSWDARTWFFAGLFVSGAALVIGNFKKGR